MPGVGLVETPAGMLLQFMVVATRGAKVTTARAAVLVVGLGVVQIATESGLTAGEDTCR